MRKTTKRTQVGLPGTPTAGDIAIFIEPDDHQSVEPSGFARLDCAPPKDWDEGSITFTPYWTGKP
jgi:hypothetical protein